MKSFILIVLVVINCLPTESKVNAWAAQSQVNAAVDFKAKECSNRAPQPPLFVFTDQEKRTLDLCTIAITRTNCPFTGYPIICLGLYYEGASPEIPWYINFNELAKQKY
jgi:hypothetical protein